MANYRRGRINEETVRVMSELLREVKDPRVSEAFISITAADVTPDLKYAKIYYSVLGGEKDEAEMKRIARNGGEDEYAHHAGASFCCGRKRGERRAYSRPPVKAVSKDRYRR